MDVDPSVTVSIVYHQYARSISFVKFHIKIRASCMHSTPSCAALVTSQAMAVTKQWPQPSQSSPSSIAKSHDSMDQKRSIYANGQFFSVSRTIINPFLILSLAFQPKDFCKSCSVVLFPNCWKEPYMVHSTKPVDGFRLHFSLEECCLSTSRLVSINPHSPPNACKLNLN